MGPREVQRQFPGKLKEADRDQTRRRRSRGRRETEKAGAGGRSDGGVEAKPGPNGRQEEACRGDHLRRTRSRDRKRTPRTISASRLLPPGQAPTCTTFL